MIFIHKERFKKFLTTFNQLEISWQIYCLIFIYIVINIVAYFLKIEIGILLSALFIVIAWFVYYNMNKFLSGINVIANNIVNDIKLANDESYNNSAIGMLLYDENERVMWINPLAQKYLEYQDPIGEELSKVNAIFEQFVDLSMDEWHIVQIQEKYFKILHEKDKRRYYLIDVNEEYQIRDKNIQNKMVYGFLLLEDYDEVIQSLNDQDTSNFDAQIVNDLNSWANRHDVYIKRIEDNKFMLLCDLKILSELEQTKFNYFKELSNQYSARNIPIAISVGIAFSNNEQYTINRLAKEAQENLDLALGRGGDQIVVKSADEAARFYGGDSNPTEKRTNTRSKLVYQALINQISQASNVLISGHKYPDLDSMSSALGLHKIVTQQRKMAKIIVNEATFNSDIQQLLSSPQINYNLKNIFITDELAREYITAKTLIILVDHHRPSMSEAENILYYGSNIVVIDHHRRSEEFPAQTVLTYIEPTASSTSELITEFFMNDKNLHEPVNRFEATALLAGIIVDTNNFSMRTGSKTFDVASYLKSRGAEMDSIQRLLKEEFMDVKIRNHLIEQTEFYATHFAIAVSEDEMIIDNVTAAQAADEMLTLKEVEASFAVYRRSRETVGISARSLGKVNVQKIMECLGGGGHLSNAAVQIDLMSVEEVKQLLIDAINQSI